VCNWPRGTGHGIHMQQAAATVYTRAETAVIFSSRIGCEVGILIIIQPLQDDDEQRRCCCAAHTAVEAHDQPSHVPFSMPHATAVSTNISSRVSRIETVCCHNNFLLPIYSFQDLSNSQRQSDRMYHAVSSHSTISANSSSELSRALALDILYRGCDAPAATSLSSVTREGSLDSSSSTALIVSSRILHGVV
jgi:hypothetical protein